jgi:AraC family transcriptional regulator of adaptative response/methylated-DNA-[protein]-cysteine methyltransferase
MSTSTPRRQVQQDPRWAAVVARDPHLDDAFYYSVSTTGIYCRPSCGARRPRPEHVRFHRTTAEAERAGFRPCLRCRPDQPPIGVRQAATVADACRAIERSTSIPSLAALARRAELSPHHFHRIFRRVTGVTPRAYAAAHRAGRVRDQLTQVGSVTDAIYASGFNSSAPFYAAAPASLGMSPTAYRSGGAGTEIRFAVGKCSLGALLVAQSAKGVCAILMGDDADALVRDLRGRFPRAAIVEGGRAFARVVARVVAVVEAPGTGLDLPLDVRGTAFQRRVWEALRRIPPGTTASYGDVASSIGAPTAARAVAGACAGNSLAVVIPCHRVVRTDGALSGYRWGVERKRRLLEREEQQARTRRRER